MHEPVKLSILATLKYFDITHFPLTKEELFRYLWKAPKVSFENFTSILDTMVGHEIEMQYGYYFLTGRSSSVESRRSKTASSDAKLRKALRAAKRIRSVPFLRAVFLSSSVASETTLPESDIDFFIVAEAKRIWIVRFFTNFILRLLGLRVYGKKRKDKICLCFYVDTNHLNLAPWRVSDEDIHFSYWLHQMVPLYDPENWYVRCMQANTWTEKLLPNVRSGQGAIFEQVRDSRVGKTWKKLWEKMWQGLYGDMVESQAQAVQWQKMRLSLKEKSKINDNSVVIQDGVLKLHENDRREFYRTEWLAKLRH